MNWTSVLHHVVNSTAVKSSRYLENVKCLYLVRSSITFIKLEICPKEHNYIWNKWADDLIVYITMGSERPASLHFVNNFNAGLHVSLKPF